MIHNIGLKLIIDEAKKRKLKYTLLYSNKLIKVYSKKHIEYFFNSNSSAISAVAINICNNKDVIKKLLELNQISVPKGKLFNHNTDFNKIKEYVQNIKFPIVVKPTSSFGGEMVFCGVKNVVDLYAIWQKIIKKFDQIIIEEMIQGIEYRVLVVQKKVVGILNRIPANVIGDGKLTINELIKTKNTLKEKQRYPKIIIDDMSREFLKNNNITLNYIPKEQEQVFLRGNSNIATGGDAVDIDENLIHKSVKKIAIKAIDSIPGLIYGGVDFLTQDITKQQTKKSYVILEVNDMCGIKYHHYPTIGKSRNIAAAILDVVFPETKKSCSWGFGGCTGI